MSSGNRQDTLAGDTVAILVPPEGPYGVVFTSDSEGNAAVIREFTRLPDGRFGPIQKHGGIHVGDVLYEINDQSFFNVPHQDVIRILQDPNLLKKNLRFLNNKEYYHMKRNRNAKSLNVEIKNNFLSTVRRSRVSEDSAGKKFIEYEIGCQLRLAASKVKKENIYQWSVWKRFSEFEALHGVLKKTLGWQMNNIDCPPAHRFSFNKLSPDFIATRLQALKEYWAKIMAIEKISDFQKAHHCSLDLRDFLEVEANTTQKTVAQAADMIEDTTTLAITNGDAPTTAPASASVAPSAVVNRRNSMKTLSNRRISGQFNGPGRPQSTVMTNSTPSSSSTPAPAPTSSSAPTSAPASAPTSSPTPPPRPAAVPPAPVAAPAAPTPAPASSSGPALPPPASGARAALFASINSRRVD